MREESLDPSAHLVALPLSFPSDANSPLQKKNDGMPGAKFLKRMQHPAATLDTLRIGNAVTLYGKTFKVFECDEFTRAYFADVGLPQPPNEEEPHDSFTESLRAKATDGDWHGKKQNPMKRYMEALRGSTTRKVDSLAKFLALSDVNLRFYALWDDTKGKMFGEKHRLCITYYLATDEVQIDRLRSARPIPGLSQLLKRSRLPRALIHHDDRPRSCEDGTGSEDYMKVDDFRVGETVNVYNREMLIYDCDETAQAWFLENRGIDQKAGAVDVSEPTKASPRLPPPPPTGYGTEEDSLMSWKHLVLRPPRKDLTRIRDATSKTLKFHAHLSSDDPIDAGRVFRICWYMDDETISVYETKSRNSGITAGKWQARERLVNAATGKYFEASDFFVGAEVLIKSHRFNIDSADDFSLAHMEGATHLWPMSSVDFAIANLKNKLREKSASLRKMFRKFDTDKSQTISFDEFRSMLDYYGMTMPKAEVLTLFRAFDPDGGGNISYEEFMAAFTDFDDEGGAGADVTHVKAVSSEDMEAYMKHVDAVAKLEGEDQYIDVLLAKLARQFKNSKHASLVHEKFREFDKNKDHTVDRGEFFAVMGPGGMNITPRDVLLLERRFFKPEDESINYETFMSVVHSYADKTMVRSS